MNEIFSKTRNNYVHKHNQFLSPLCNILNGGNETILLLHGGNLDNKTHQTLLFLIWLASSISLLLFL